MKKSLSLLAVLVLGLLSAAPSRAFDDSRKGFVLGFGLGPGWAMHDYPHSVGPAWAWRSAASSFKIGAGLSDKVLLYYSNRVAFYGDGRTVLQGATSAAVSYYLEPTERSSYFSCELGVGTRRGLEAGSDSDNGFGVTIGAGFEFTRHFAVETSYMHAYLDGTSSDASNVTVTLNWLGF